MPEQYLLGANRLFPDYQDGPVPQERSEIAVFYDNLTELFRSYIDSIDKMNAVIEDLHGGQLAENDPDAYARRYPESEEMAIDVTERKALEDLDYIRHNLRRLHQVERDWNDRGNVSTNTRYYLNEYADGRDYGGPEEGGWYYTRGLFVGNLGIYPHFGQAQEAEKLLTHYIRTKRKGIPHPSSVASSPGYPSYPMLRIETRPGRDFPDEVPQYE